MKFESVFGIGEIVAIETYKNGELVRDELLEVVAIQFAKNANDEVESYYICEYPKTGHRVGYSESRLIGDPSFDQEAGAYPVSPED